MSHLEQIAAQIAAEQAKAVDAAIQRRYIKMRKQHWARKLAQADAAAATE